MSSDSQTKIFFGDEKMFDKKIISIKNIIVDRKSKYSICYCYVESKEDVDNFIKYILKDNFYKKATHNSYAFRIKLENKTILEGKNDDGEIGAGMCILRELQKENSVNIILVVTRYFGGIKLQNDRFKNIINSCKMFYLSRTKVFQETGVCQGDDHGFNQLA